MLSGGMLVGRRLAWITARVPSNSLQSVSPSEHSLSQRAVIKTCEMVYTKSALSSDRIEGKWCFWMVLPFISSEHFYLLSSVSLPLCHPPPPGGPLTGTTLVIRDHCKICFNGLLLFFWQILPFIKQHDLIPIPSIAYNVDLVADVSKKQHQLLGGKYLNKQNSPKVTSTFKYIRYVNTSV